MEIPKSRDQNSQKLSLMTFQNKKNHALSSDSLQSFMDHAESSNLLTNRAKKKLNELLFANKVKLIDISKLETEIDSIQKINSGQPRYDEISKIIKETATKTLSIEEDNRNYEFLKLTVHKQKTEWKKKCNEIKEILDKFELKYSKVIESKDFAINQYIYARQALTSYRSSQNQAKELQKTKYDSKLQKKKQYSMDIQKMIENIENITTKHEQNTNKIANTLAKVYYKLEQMNGNKEKIKYYQEIEEITNSFKAKALELLHTRGQPCQTDKANILSCMIKMYKEEEYKSISLSMKFQELSNEILVKKEQCTHYRTELAEAGQNAIVHSTFFQEHEEEKLKNHKGNHEENVLIHIYARVFMLASDILDKIKHINDYSPSKDSSMMPNLEDLNSLISKHGEFSSKKSIKIPQRSKTLLRTNSFHNIQISRSPVTRKSQLNHISSTNIIQLCKEYFKDNFEASNFLLNNQIISLFLTSNDAIHHYQTSLSVDALYLYSMSHVNIQNVMQKLIKRIKEAVCTAKESVPEGFEPKTPKDIELVATQYKKAQKIVAVHETPRTSKDKSTEEFRKILRKRLKLKSTPSLPSVLYGNNSEAQKEIRELSNRLRKLEVNEKKGNSSTRNSFDINSYKFSIPKNMKL